MRRAARGSGETGHDDGPVSDADPGSLDNVLAVTGRGTRQAGGGVRDTPPPYPVLAYRA
jgi:hypothetical protein